MEIHKNRLKPSDMVKYVNYLEREQETCLSSFYIFST